MTKRCYVCKELLDETAFNKNKTRSDGLQNKCKNCNKKILKEHYNKNKQYYYKKNKIKRKELTKKLRDFKATLICLTCGENDPRCLDFHHLKDKVYIISEMPRLGFSFTNILKEIEKCMVLCANCHRKETLPL